MPLRWAQRFPGGWWGFGGLAAGAGLLGWAAFRWVWPKPIGVLQWEGGELALTRQDALWAARMVVGEERSPISESDAATLVGILLRRYAAVTAARGRRGEPPLWSSFTALLKAYSEPLQERQAHRERPARVQALTWSEIPAPIRQGVLDVMTGARPLPLEGTGAVHFAAGWFIEPRFADHPDWRTVRAGVDNVVVSSATGRRGPEPVVRSV